MRLLAREDFIIFPAVVLAMISRSFRHPLVERLSIALLSKLALVFSRRKIDAIQLALDAAYGDSLAVEERKSIVRGSLRSVWVELFRLVAGPARSDSDKFEIHGLDRIDAGRARGRGVILWETNGLGARWAPKRLLLERGYAVHQVHGSNHMGGFFVQGKTQSLLQRLFFRPFFNRCEAYFVDSLSFVPPEDSLVFARELASRLRRNEIICITGDGTMGQRVLSLPFLGVHADFSTGMVSLARLSGADLLPMFCIRQLDGTLVLNIEDAIPVNDSQNRDEQVRASLSRYAQLLETYVRRYPAQYRNWFKLVGHDANTRRVAIAAAVKPV